jgi:hypothetical protein
MALQWDVERRIRIPGAIVLREFRARGETIARDWCRTKCRRTIATLTRYIDAIHKSLVSLQNPSARRNAGALGTAFAQ